MNEVTSPTITACSDSNGMLNTICEGWVELHRFSTRAVSMSIWTLWLWIIWKSGEFNKNHK